MNVQPLIEVTRVSKIIRNGKSELRILEDVNLSVFEGEVVCLIGPSGSGKSTCLRCIGGLETISSGSIKICGQDYHSGSVPLHTLRRHSPMVFQRFELFSHLTALENVALAPRLVLNKSKTQSLQLASDLLERFGLKAHMNKYPRSLSGGQQQRVGIARALSVNPKVLLCDEPTSALDPELVGEVVDIFIELAKSGMTMVIVTHEMAFAEKVATHCVFLEHGRISRMGSKVDFFNSERTDRISSFLRAHSQEARLNNTEEMN